jgi:hypothetical protein
VGFIYPPQTILLFAPLGLFSRSEEASALWYGFNSLCLVISIVVLWRAFFKDYGTIGLIIVALLVTVFHPTTSAFVFGQPLPVMLMLLSLYLIANTAVQRGILLGASFAVKPFAIAFLLKPLIRRSWTEIAAAAATIAAAFIGAVLLVGWQNVVPYFTNGPSQRYPLYVWLEGSNDSLFSAALRITHEPAPASLGSAHLYLGSALVVSLVTLALCYRFRNSDPRVLLSFLIAYSLLVFPPSAAHYNVLLLIPIFVLWEQYSKLAPMAIIVYLAALYGLQEFWLSPWIFLGPLSVWLIFACALALPHREVAPATYRRKTITLGR